MDITKRKNSAQHLEIGELLAAAAEGDMRMMVTLRNSGTNLYVCDYDQRTAMHLAATMGNANIVKYLIENAPEKGYKKCLSPKDRWSGTPLGDANYHGHEECAKLLRNAGAIIGKQGHLKSDKELTADDCAEISTTASTVLFAAAEGDMRELIRLNAAGINIHVGDYDRRTGLHLAASNGHPKALKYLLV